tara:strand:- start:6093 stop:6635 length:543 start_codon:yes stop_codon:yes gene_type:complete
MYKMVPGEYEEASIKGVIALVLAICTNFVGQTLSCHTQKILSENMLAKHIIIILSVFVAIDSLTFSSKEPGYRQSPLDTLKMTALVYLMFILFTRMHRVSTVVAFVIVLTLYFTDLCIAHYKPSNVDTINRIRNVFMYGFIANLILGYIAYAHTKRKEYGKEFSWNSFIFGIPECKLKNS